ncbi:hypothetical protein ASPCADRAFT_509511 [Aspergillus carbonarius ITEM 5010]|uniref:F-box domain-containing protein n=1 Tax=Aspergillus carbonarius (strain ITEM 5010) TaxID=602072 RepID=A0A1R3RDM2_ASPC5|nr:hypothetical protein ASPCADRAFT_509511 [Aspergillus carbonarius ITEM 5010]
MSETTQTPVRSAKAGIPSIFWRRELAGFIFNNLPRHSLKSLRLTCKYLDYLIVSSLSHLFSRVYVSANDGDIKVLALICENPRIAACVRELVWDVTLFNYDRFRRAGRAPILYEHWNNSRRGCDYMALVKALPRLTGLKHATLTSLMSRWITIDHSTRSPAPALFGHVVDESQVNHPHPTRPYICPFESPAMRDWRRQGHNWSKAEQLSETFPPSIDPENDEIYNNVMRLVDSEQNEPIWDCVHKKIQYRQDRAQLLLLTACRRFHVDLLSYSVDAPHISCDPMNRSPSIGGFQGIVLSAPVRSGLMKAGISEQLRSLRRLSLTLDGKTWHKWHHAFYTEDLQTLELRVFNEAIFGTNLLDAPFRNLKELVLGNFRFSLPGFNSLMAWCAAHEVQTLHLIDPVFASEFILPDRNRFLNLILRENGDWKSEKDSSTYENWKIMERIRNEDNDVSSDSSEEDRGMDFDVEPAVPFTLLDFPPESESEDSDYISDSSEGGNPDASDDFDAMDEFDEEYSDEDDSDEENQSDAGDESETMDASDASEDSSGSMDIDLTTKFGDLAIEPSDPDYSESDTDESSESDEDETDILDELPFPRVRPYVGRYLLEIEGESFELELYPCHRGYGKGISVLIDGYRTKC